MFDVNQDGKYVQCCIVNEILATSELYDIVKTAMIHFLNCDKEIEEVDTHEVLFLKISIGEDIIILRYDNWYGITCKAATEGANEYIKSFAYTLKQDWVVSGLYHKLANAELNGI